MKIGPYKIFSKRIIGGIDDPLMIRWILFRCPAWGLYVHKFCRSDYDRALHDHPWPFIAWIVKGGYWERHNQTIDGSETLEYRPVGRVLVRPAEWRHRVILSINSVCCDGKYIPSWSIVLVGRRCRRWGFFVPQKVSGDRIDRYQVKWCWWRQYDMTKGICSEEILWEGNED